MGIKVVLEFSDEDLKYFRGVMDTVWKRIKKKEDSDVIAAAREQLAFATKTAGAEYVQARLKDIDVLIDMIEDKDWPLEKDDRNRILVAIGYFGVPNDMIPDKTPGIGFLDDALMAELVVRELKPELEGYADFCEYREGERTMRGKTVDREDWLAAKRRQVWLRIRRQREERRHRTTAGPTLPILRYRY
jgi:uncharacterized membrane protein YkvA (DUF1232 family)